MKRLFCLLLLAAQTLSAQVSPPLPALIPMPAKVTKGTGDFRITRKTVIAAQDDEDRKTARYLNQYLKQFYGFTLDIDRKEGSNVIRLTTRKFIKAPDKDGYTLQVGKEGVLIEGDTYAGTFYGVQTLIQLLPVMDVRKLVNDKGGIALSQLIIPVVSIQDAPRFAYRGMHLDVSRHFSELDFVKKYIDLLALHKLNYFHWHLTDDQGWRIEIKKYPLLTQVGGYRNGTIIGRYPGTGNDNQRYGGFYTQDEVREVIRYAADRFITVIPEIEMPGHASAAIAAYPWLSCFPEEPTKIPSHPSLVSQRTPGKKVQETWGVFDDVFCAGNDSTFTFLEGVLDEVVALFPANYVHVGGDECPKVNWKRCPRCQARMKTLGLKDEHELQSYFIQRMERYLNAKDRTIIGWDEILEGGLAPNAVVMSWRGEKGGIEAAQQSHKVIMTPQKPVYFDHTQSRSEDSVTIGGYNPIDHVYAYEPVPKELSADKAAYIMGAQANMWREYSKTPAKVEYMVLPRMSALSEVLWSDKTVRSWPDFEKRLQTQFQRYDFWGYNYSRAYFEIKASILPAKDGNGLVWQLQTAQPVGQIKYTSGAIPTETVYKTPVQIRKSDTYTAQYYKGSQVVNKLQQTFTLHKASGKKITLAKAPNERYPGQGGAFGLINGIYSTRGLSYPDWLGWIGEDLVATIDLGKSTPVSSLRLHTIEQNGSWIYLPQDVVVEGSVDGKTFKLLGSNTSFVKDTLTMGFITVPFPVIPVRYLRVTAKNLGLIPDGKPGAGNKAWVFADELIVE